ncbi:MAG: hypothetical protein ACQESR_19670 [Planctomycetota bacterium]
MEWTFETRDEVSRRVKKLEKRYSEEISAVYDNLQTYMDALESGLQPLQLVQQCRFVHNEGKDVYAIDQSPKRKGYAEMRLYVYADVSGSKLHLLTIGLKNQQQGDVRECHKFVEKHRKESA